MIAKRLPAAPERGESGRANTKIAPRAPPEGPVESCAVQIDGRTAAVGPEREDISSPIRNIGVVTEGIPGVVVLGDRPVINASQRPPPAISPSLGHHVRGGEPG